VQNKMAVENYKHNELHRFDDEKIIKTLALWRNIVPDSEAMISVLLTSLVVPLRQ
jgi:hypothetical protein